MGAVIDQVASHLVAVLCRAESLFAEPDRLDPPEHLGAAVGAGEAISARTAELAGAMAAAHDTYLAQATARLRDSAAVDARLAEQLRAVGEGHREAAATARRLREDAETIRDTYGPGGGAGGDVAVLQALRAKIAAMQGLIGEQGERASAAGDLIRGLGAGQG